MNYRELLVKYMAMIDHEEDSCFLDRLDWTGITFTLEERAELFRLQDDAIAFGKSASTRSNDTRGDGDPDP
jgi:hypothetical protein